MKIINTTNGADQKFEERRSVKSKAVSHLLLLTGLMMTFAASAFAQGGQVCLYELPNYGGRSVCFSPGQAVSELQSVRGGWNDRAQSVRVTGNANATIYEHAGFTGASFFVDSDVPYLGEIGRRRGGLANEVSSITVDTIARQVGRRSDYDEAYRLGQRDATRGLNSNYRQYSSRYDRWGEAEFRRGYNEGYQSARNGNNRYRRIN